ncbi:MAG: amidohydrolase family protein [Streptosporangiales bacterium]|nr:amidohydrolase family protein [Streptosporangiales bacterium]
MSGLTDEVDLLVTGGEVVRPGSAGHEVERLDVAVVDGRITGLLAPGDPRPGVVRRELSALGCLVVPGFVNAHSHSYGMLGRTQADLLPLEPWMVYANAITANRTEREVALAATLSCVELVRSGTTTVLDHLGGQVSGLGAAAQAYLDFGMRAVVAPMIGDVPLHHTVELTGAQWPSALWEELEAAPVPSAGALLDATKDLLGSWHGREGRIRVFVGPSGPQRCTDDLLRGCAELAADFDTGVHMHLIETRNQAATVRRLYGTTAVEHLDRLGLVNERFMGAHGVWCSESELRLLGERGAALVHNPWSNLYVGSGIAPLTAWRRHGVRIAIGTDGANCGCDLSMPLAMRLAASLHRAHAFDPAQWPTPGEIFTAATAGSAAALGWADEIGTVEEGKAADLAVIDASGTAYVPRYDPLAQLVYGETGGNVRHTVIAGQVVMQDRVIASVDERDLLREAQEAATALRQRNDGLFRAADAQAEVLSRASATAPVPADWPGAG